jgi:hypothetical protein
MSEPARVQLDSHVWEVGAVMSVDGWVRIGIDYDTVSILIAGQEARLPATAMEEFAQLFVSAVWQAGQQKARLDEEAAAKGAFDMAPGMSSGLPSRTCTCGQRPHDQHCPALDDR